MSKKIKLKIAERFETILICIKDDYDFMQLGDVEDWVQKGDKYFLDKVHVDVNDFSKHAFSISDKNRNPVIPNGKYSAFSPDRFALFMQYHLN